MVSDGRARDRHGSVVCIDVSAWYRSCDAWRHQSFVSSCPRRGECVCWHASWLWRAMGSRSRSSVPERTWSGRWMIRNLGSATRRGLSLRQSRWTTRLRMSRRSGLPNPVETVVNFVRYGRQIEWLVRTLVHICFHSRRDGNSGLSDVQNLASGEGGSCTLRYSLGVRGVEKSM